MFSVTEFFKDIKLIRDPLYGFIEVPKEFLPVLDHKLVQRLRWISQLPLEQLVYPSAQHSRFEHSIGTMYLSMQTAIALIRDKISWEKIQEAFNIEERKGYVSLGGEKEKKRFFVYAAGLCGLLHDVGHAPFSHTLEEAVHYTKNEIDYNHERVSFLVAKKILSEFNDGYDGVLSKVILTVLDKNFSLMEITPLKRILRSIIDNVIDADKGDYLLRDSYHCGVIYGKYDVARLWRHVRITSEWKIGVSEKGAIEAWNLRLARFKMYKNVYKHHVRNITDALLVDILTDVFDADDNELVRNIIPVQSQASELTEEDALKFYTWTENEVLKNLSLYNNNSIKSKVEAFLKRHLPKRFLKEELEKYGVEEKNKENIQKIRNVLKGIETSKEIKLFFLIDKEHLPPVFTQDVQRDLIVVIDEEREIPLAKYLKFSIPSNAEDLENYSVPSLILEVFAEKNAPLELKEILRKEFEEKLFN